LVKECEEFSGLNVSPDGLLLVEMASLDADVGNTFPRVLRRIPFSKSEVTGLGLSS
jgi:hypothetical protein